MNYLWLYFKGIAMGCADLVPGVSGGTIAFITGIYTELLDSIKSVDIEAAKILFNKGPAAAWQHINGNFLITLLAGVLTAVGLLASVITYVMDTYPIYLWSFFFGLILAGSWHMLKQIEGWDISKVLILLAGIVFTAFISLTSPSEVALSPLTLVMGGSIAICAMILPGLSGAFLLLLMGMYAPVLAALKGFELVTIIWFVGGCLIGLLAFSRVLSWLLHHYQFYMYALLTGFMLGALAKVWPWKETISYRLDSHGEQIPFVQHMALPDFSDIATLSSAIVSMLVGFMIVLLMEKVSAHNMSSAN